MTVELDSAVVAQYLQDHPQFVARFFEENAEMLSTVRLSSVLGGRTVSLQDRQIEVLREKIKTLELRLTQLFRVGEENDALNNRFHSWTRGLLTARNDVDLPYVLVEGLKTIFGVPYATLRVWNVSPDFTHAWFAREVSDDTRIFASSLQVPFCGPNNDFEAVRLLDDAADIGSAALLPLRTHPDQEAFGLLVLGSEDRNRFTSDMATDFLSRIADTSAAAIVSLTE